MARWNNLPGALIAAILFGGGFVLYGHPWFGAMFAAIFLVVWAADTWIKRQERLTPCEACGRRPDGATPHGRTVTHPLRPLFFQVIPANPRDLGPPCRMCGEPTPKAEK